MLNISKIQKEKPIKDLLNFSIINIDKPSGPTSFAISQYVKNSLNLNKTSHLGTLDPMVSGVLPIALGRACRLNDYLMHRDKKYVGIMRLHSEIDEKTLQTTIKDFLGKITQLPPLKSRVKRAQREREIKSFNIIERDGKDILFETEVQAGTYIRKLIHDIGLKIGGAHMLELRRINAGIFSEEGLSTLYDFDKLKEDFQKGGDKIRAHLIPGEIITTILPTFEVSPECLKSLLTGSPVFLKSVINPKNIEGEQPVCIISKDKFIGVYRTQKSNSVFAVPEFVFN